MTSIPIIDLAKSLTGDLACRKATASKIRDACTTNGVFFVTNHGIPQETYDGIMRDAKRFYAMPSQVKVDILRTLFAPYGGMSSGFAVALSKKESKQNYGWKYEPRLDARIGKLENDTGSTFNVWPTEEELPGFFDSLKAYYNGAFELAEHIWKLIALSLDLAEDHFLQYTSLSSTNGRILYYPAAEKPIPLEETTSDDIGLGSHIDYQSFTINHPSSKGLEVLLSGQWVEVPETEGGLVINIGETLAHWTNGIFVPTPHRVVNRLPEARYSIPIFQNVKWDTLIETLPSCITEDRPNRSAAVTAGEFYMTCVRNGVQRDLNRPQGGKGQEMVIKMAEALMTE